MSNRYIYTYDDYVLHIVLHKILNATDPRLIKVCINLHLFNELKVVGIDRLIVLDEEKVNLIDLINNSIRVAKLVMELKLKTAVDLSTFLNKCYTFNNIKSTKTNETIHVTDYGKVFVLTPDKLKDSFL